MQGASRCFSDTLDISIPSERTVYRVMEEIGLNHKPKRKPNGITKADKEARCLFHKPALNGVSVLYAVGIRIGDFRTEFTQSVRLLINISDTVLPNFR